MKKFTRKYNRIGRSSSGRLEDLLFIDDNNKAIFYVSGRSLDWYKYHGMAAEKEIRLNSKKEIDTMYKKLQSLGYNIIDEIKADNYLF